MLLARAAQNLFDLGEDLPLPSTRLFRSPGSHPHQVGPPPRVVIRETRWGVVRRNRGQNGGWEGPHRRVTCSGLAQQGVDLQPGCRY